MKRDGGGSGLLLRLEGRFGAQWGRRAVASLLYALGAGLLLGGCAQPAPPLYHWGSYEAQVHAAYNDPGKVSPQEQVAQLEADYQRARALNRAVPPGFHAHLGYLYFQIGRLDEAQQSFRTEAALFPESKVYMDRLSARLQAPPVGRP